MGKRRADNDVRRHPRAYVDATVWPLRGEVAVHTAGNQPNNPDTEGVGEKPGFESASRTSAAARCGNLRSLFFIVPEGETDEAQAPVSPTPLCRRSGPAVQLILSVPADHGQTVDTNEWWIERRLVARKPARSRRLQDRLPRRARRRRPDLRRITAPSTPGREPQTAGGLPVVCLPGLARTVADFETLATALASDPAAPRRVIALDSRGRGQSDYDPDPANYSLPVGLADVLAVLTALDIGQAAFIGTSRGGILTMLLAVARPTAVAAAVLNDIGPVIDLKRRSRAAVGAPRGHQPHRRLHRRLRAGGAAVVRSARSFQLFETSLFATASFQSLRPTPAGGCVRHAFMERHR
jgi:pimeloyl-ACP methyl ester carboxylesterase